MVLDRALWPCRMLEDNASGLFLQINVRQAFNYRQQVAPENSNNIT
jgi:hypothetical protein